MRSVLSFSLLIFFSGCLCDAEYCRYPDFFHPGNISEQQERAHQFDPFSRSESGPKIVGERPSGALDPTPASQLKNQSQ